MAFHYHLGTMAQAAGNIVQKCLHLKVGEKLVIVADQYTWRLLEPVYQKALPILGAKNIIVRYLEDFGPRDREKGVSLKPERVLALSGFKRLLKELEKTEAFIYAGVSLGRELVLRDRMRKAGTANNGRMLLLPNLNRDIMGMGFCADQELMQAYTDVLFELVNQAAWIELTTPAGTDVLAAFGLRWLKAGSILSPGEFANVGAEIYTCPVSIDGVWMTDGGMGDVFNVYGELKKTPLQFQLKSGMIVKAGCKNKELLRHFQAYADSDRHGNGRRIGEFALSTNPEIAELGLIGVNMQDEKALPHIAIGIPRADLAMAGIIPERFHWDSDVHVDCTARAATVTVHYRDKKTLVIFKDGHPTEDVFQKMRPAAAGLLKKRLQKIRCHRLKNDPLPLEKREQVIQFD